MTGHQISDIINIESKRKPERRGKTAADKERKTMKKYNIENKVATPEMVNGSEPWTEISANYVGDYIEAETAAEAISLAIDYLVDAARDNGYDAEADYDENEIKILNDNDELTDLYFDFRAKEVD